MINYGDIKKHISILLVDDDLEYLQVVSMFLKTKGFNVVTSDNGQDTIKMVESNNINIVLIDYYMPGMTGEEAIVNMREKNSEVIIILQTGYSGQQPPAETLERLNIQNYHDKVDGIDKLYLQVLSAVRIFAQQNEIMLERYRTNSIGKLISGIAQELKSPIMALSAGIEAENIILGKDSIINAEVKEKFNKFSSNNKTYVEKIDKVLSTIINQSLYENTEEYLSPEDIINRIELILSRTLKENEILLEKNIKLRNNTVLYGKISDCVFILCEFIQKTIVHNKNKTTISLEMSEDENSWIMNCKCEGFNEISNKDMFILENILHMMPDVTYQFMNNEFNLNLNKAGKQ